MPTASPTSTACSGAPRARCSSPARCSSASGRAGRRTGSLVPLQLQMLPAEMLPLTRNEVLPGGNVIRQGIEFDRIGRRVAYHFLRRHPGDVTDPGLAGETVRIPAVGDHPRHRSGRRRPAARCLEVRAGDRQAVPARPVRRRRARPEEGGGDARAVHHHPGAGRAVRCGREHRRGWRADDGSAAGADRHAGAGRAGADLRSGRLGRRPTSRSSTAPCCRSRRRWASPTRTSRTT